MKDNKLRRIGKRRYLRPLVFGKKSKKFYVFDTETGIKHANGKIEYMLSARPEHLIFGVVYGPDGYYKIIDSPDGFRKEFLKDRYRNKIVYAHNAEYDLSAVYGNIYELDRGAIFNGKFISCSNGVCRFADSYNVLPASVKKLGELLGLKKEQLGDANLNSHIDKIQDDINYCYRDCEIVYKSLEKVFNEVEPSYTIGALALKIFRNKYLDHTIKVNEYSDHFFDAMYGGRTEAFRIGNVNAHVYDINSAYPFVMKDNNFPNPAKLRMIENPNSETALHILKNYEGMITATVRVDPSEKLPVLPFRFDNRLIFPCGEFTGSWCFPEYMHALAFAKTKTVKVHKIVFAPAIESPFNNFISDYWNHRISTNDVFEKYYDKLFMNNLYGKLVQRAREEFRFCTSNKEAKEFMREKKIKRAEIIDVNGGFFLRYETNKIFNHTIACWGAYVTNYVRIQLHVEMTRHGDDLVYCDTDSIFSEKEINLNSKELGGWKKEDKMVTKIRALKDYVYIDSEGEKQMLKGVRKDWVQLDSEANVFKGKRMIRTRESMRRVDNLPPGTFIQQIKTLTGDYMKREVLSNGKTKPFIL